MPSEESLKQLKLAFSVLAAIDAEVLTQEKLAWQLGIDSTEIERKLKLLRTLFNVRVKSGDGYEIEDWGVFNRERLLQYAAGRRTRKSASARKKCDRNI